MLGAMLLYAFLLRMCGGSWREIRPKEDLGMLFCPNRSGHVIVPSEYIT